MNDWLPEPENPRPWTPHVLSMIEDSIPVEHVVDHLFARGGPLEQAGLAYRPQQHELARMVARRIDRRDGWALGQAPCGCHAKGQGILMYDGSSKPVEDVVVGDRLMGPDSRPRMVLALARGRESMVDVIPTKGTAFRVNRSHVLTLVRQGKADPERSVHRKNGEIIDVVTSDVIDAWSKARRSLYRLFRASVREFGGERAILPIPPWVLGALLGDGGFNRHDADTTFTNVDPELTEEMKLYVESIGCRFVPRDERHNSIIGSVGYRKNPLRNLLRELGLFGTDSGSKFIPTVYKIASWEDRKEILAGLIDTDGSYNGRGGFDYISKSKQLADDVAFVARSLGLAAYVSSCEKSSQTGYRGVYFRVLISGDCSIIPIRTPRKRAPKRRINKDPLRTGFRLVEREEEEFYGFSLDGDGRFLLDDFTVTHNTGKGQAYLIPGVIATLRARAKWRPDPDKRNAIAPRMVVSTANVALQGQLVEKDVPMLARTLGIRVRVGLLKGRNNYVCWSRLNETLLTRFTGDVARGDLEHLWAYLNDHPDAVGDRDGLPFAVSPQAWARASVDAQACAKDGCPHYDPAPNHAPCFAEMARASAVGAEVLVVNHHYLGAAAGSLSPCTLLAVDEAHAFEDALRATQTKELRVGTAHHAGRLARPVYGSEGATLVGGPILRLLDAAKDWMRRTGAGSFGRRPLSPGWASASGLTEKAFEPIEQAVYALDLLAKAPVSNDDEKRAASRAENAAEQLRSFHERCVTLLAARPSPDDAAEAPGPWAMWAEASGGDSVALGYCPADVSKRVLGMQRAFPAGVLVSATLDFDATAVALGMLADRPSKSMVDPSGKPIVPTSPVKPAETVAVASPFPLADLGVLVVPRGPGPKDATWPEWSVGQTVEAVQASKGGALVLCSSRRQVDAVAGALRDLRAPWTLLVQGEAGRTELRDRFKADIDSVLVGTKSFFEGLDVVGEACRLVVIDRLPFDPPGDPVEDAVGLLASERVGGGSPFVLRSLPRACALLAQAAGRLVRSPTDRGALLVLDTRVLQQSSIGGAARRALPPFPLSRDVADVGRHLAGQKLALVPLPPEVTVNGRAPETVAESVGFTRRTRGGS